MYISTYIIIACCYCCCLGIVGNQRFHYPNEQEDVFGDAKISLKRYLLKNMPENHYETTKKTDLHRKREALPFTDRFHGQTQSQYLNIDTNKQNEGKAEAQATQQSSRAVVSGSNGMGQAQSMSSGYDGCEDCLKFNKPGSLILESKEYLTDQILPASFPLNAQIGSIAYPIGTQSGIISPSNRISNFQSSDGIHSTKFIRKIKIAGEDRNTQREKSQSAKISPNTQPIQNIGTKQGTQISDEVPGVQMSSINSSQGIQTLETMQYSPVTYSDTLHLGTQTIIDVYSSNVTTFSEKESISNLEIKETNRENFPRIIQIPEININSSKYQTKGFNNSRNQVSGITMYPQVLEIVGDQTSDVQIIKGNTHPSNILVADQYYPQTQMSRKNRYNQNKQVKPNLILNTHLKEREKNTDSIKSVPDLIETTQIESTNTYKPRIQIIENGEPSSQISKANMFPSITQKLKGLTYPTSIQIVNNPVLDPGVLERNTYFSDKQIISENILRTQIGTEKAYSSEIPILVNNIKNTPVSKITLSPPDTIIIKNNMAKNELLRQIPYSENRQIIDDDVINTIENREKNMNSSNMQVIEGGNSEKQIPQGYLYLPEIPLKEGSVLARMPVGIRYSSGTKLVSNSNVDTQNLHEIKYLPIIQRKGVSNLYLPSTQIVIEDISKKKIAQQSSYQSNPQIPTNNTPQNQILGEPVYFSNTQFQDLGRSEGPMLSTILYPTEIRVDDSVLGVKIPEQIYPSTNKARIDTSEIQRPHSVYLSSLRNVLNNNLRMQNLQGNLYLPGMHVSNTLEDNILGEIIYPINKQSLGNPMLQTPKSEENLYSSGRSNIESSASKNKDIGENIYPQDVWIPNLQNKITNSQEIRPTEEAYISTDTLGSQTSYRSQDNIYPEVMLTEKAYPSDSTTQINYSNTNISSENIENNCTLEGAQKDQRAEMTVDSNADDSSDSQAMSSVKQGKAGTLASASAQGKHGHGNAKSQVSGIYTGTGSFSAQAGTSDDKKSAQTQISASKDGVNSNAQGNGGLGKSQTQVQLDSDSGITSTNAQSSGWNHNTNSQVQASATGGMADAQASGEGQTSSQSQIGFQPHINRNQKFEKLVKPFHGGGTASAQSSILKGQSQSQLQGSFHYGISYSGAAQARSGADSNSLRKFNFTDTELKLIKPVKFEKNKKIETTTQIASKEQLNTSDMSLRQATITMNQNYKHLEKQVKSKQPYSYDFNNTDDEYHQYEDENYSDLESMQPVSLFNETNQRMHLFTNNGFNQNIKHEDNTRVSLPGYIASIHKNFMTSLLTKQITPKNITTQNKTMIELFNGTTISKSSSERSLHSDRVGGIYYGDLKNSRIQEKSFSPKTNLVSVSNNIASRMENTNFTTKYEQRYFTKSSTCGYFTFSCNLVYGSSGRRKICKPKIPTHSDKTSKC